MKTHLRRVLRIAVTAWVLLVMGACTLLSLSVTGACNGASDLQNGMQEADVIRLLGEPRVVTRPDLMSGFFFEEKVKSCLPRATKVFVYDRWIRNDVSVAVDTKGTVVCFEVVKFF